MNEDSLNWYQQVSREYPEEMILLAARECARPGRTLTDVKNMLDSWRKKGIMTSEQAEKYVRRFRAQGEPLRELRKMWGLSSLSGDKNRELLSKWENELGFSPELILTAAEAAAGTDRPMLYLDAVLQAYAKKGIRTKEQIQKEREERKEKGGTDQPAKPVKQVAAQMYSQRDYSGPEETIEEMMKRMGGGKKPNA